MQTIEVQLKLEQQMSDNGAASYAASIGAAEEAGRGSETSHASRLMQEFLLPLIAELQVFTGSSGPAARGKARGLLRRCAPEKAMLLALKQVFNSFCHTVQVVQIAAKIGQQVEDEIRFSRFQEMHEDYYNKIIEDFKRKGTKDYRFMHRVLTNSANKEKDQWLSWTQAERVDVGMRLIDIILRETNLVEKKIIKNKMRMEAYLQPTPEAQEWIKNHQEMSGLMFPDKMPCVIKPDPWVAQEHGGYYSPALRQATPMVKTSGPEQRRLLEKLDTREIQYSLNIVQDVPWSVNQRVLDVAKLVWQQNLSIGMPPSEKLTPSPNPISIPKEEMNEAQMARFTDWKREASEVYTQEKERVSKCFQVSRIMRMANQYRNYETFWYVWYADFRGRLYPATAGFSPQGPDLAKGLLHFGNAKPLGERGWYWLKVHGANRYGYDKADYEDRVSWVDARHEEWMAAATDPLSFRQTWADADKPWQFLAWLFEYRDAFLADGGPETFASRLPVGLDGSCNGLQNFSAMLRDERGGRATNLIPNASGCPSDIYAEVAKVCYDKLMTHKDTDPMAASWLTVLDKMGLKGQRALAKRPVMTLPYGATRQSCTRYIFATIVDPKYDCKDLFPEGLFKAAVWLTPFLWTSIGNVVVAAREGMDWLQKCATAMSRVGKPIIWTTSDGFPVVQFSKVVNTVQIDTQLAGRFQVRVGTVSNTIDPSRQRSGVAPNFVHSQDAAHLRRTVRLARKFGIKDMAVIHDDYGTHACDTDLFHKIIRAAFVQEYRDRCPLTAFAEAQEAAGGTLPELPNKGSLDLSAVIHSPHFFG